MVDIAQEYIWIVVVGFIVAFILCLGIGANDVANTFGTSVGAKVLTLRQACILATIFETAGAIFLGAKVSETVRKGIIDIGMYQNNTEEFLVGNIAALSGSAIWMFLATFLKLPVSATHSIVGATVGFALVANGIHGIDWIGLVKIVLSWFVSPVMSGLITMGVFFICDYFILRKADPLEPGLQWLPIFYGVTIVINLFSMFYEGPEMLKFDQIPLWGVFVLSCGGGLLAAVLVRFFLVPWQRKKILEELSHEYDTVNKGDDDEENIGCSVTVVESTAAFIKEEEKVGEPRDLTVKVYPEANGNSHDHKLLEKDSNNNGDCKAGWYLDTQGEDDRDQDCELSELNQNGSGKLAVLDDEKSGDLDEMEVSSSGEKKVEIKDRPETARLFSFLQILTAVFGAFAHGGNDVSNGIGPLISIWLVALSGDVVTSALTPIWLLAYGGAGISLGLWLWGRRVIETMGQDLTTVTPSSGFSIELGAAMTVLVASNCGIPISSTHCKVGSIVFVGRLRSKGNVDWALFRNIILSWVITLPACIAFSAFIMFLLSFTL